MGPACACIQYAGPPPGRRIVAWRQLGVGNRWWRRTSFVTPSSENSRMKSRYSIFSLARNARNYHKDWERAWRSPDPKAEYDVVIVGAGGHGLATAYYLAKNHKLTNIA